jgi:hypothetical protein
MLKGTAFFRPLREQPVTRICKRSLATQVRDLPVVTFGAASEAFREVIRNARM